MTWAGWLIVGLLGYGSLVVIANDKMERFARVGAVLANLGMIVLILAIGTGHV